VLIGSATIARLPLRTGDLMATVAEVSGHFRTQGFAAFHARGVSRRSRAGRVSIAAPVLRFEMADEGAVSAAAGAAKPGRHREEYGVEFSRIVAFSDGVFAIAITLLVLALDVPEHTDDLTRVLEDQSGDLFAYALSFAVLGKWWLIHHRFFSSLERFDGGLMGLNLFYLAWIALVPFTSEVLGDYGGQTAGVVVYAANMAGVALTFSAQIVYSYRRGLTKPELRGYERRFAGPVTFITGGIFLASIPVAFLSPLAATLMWLLVFFAGGWIEDRLGGLKTA
jgi:uncharacterized membrane protein